MGGQYGKEWEKCISRGSHVEVNGSNRVPLASPFFACEELRCHCRSRLGEVPAVDLLIRPALTESRWATTPINTCDGRWERDKGRDTPPPDHQRGPACSAGTRSGLQASACWGIQTCPGLIYGLRDLESKSCTNTHSWAQCVACDAWSCDTCDSCSQSFVPVSSNSKPIVVRRQIISSGKHIDFIENVHSGLHN